jgi:pyruvate carboxylase
MANEVGYPVMLKASWGGGGRGMRIIRSKDELEDRVFEGRREAASAFGKDEVYLEKLVEAARHVEVQIVGDLHGNVVHLYERDCTVQRRNQKVIERAPAQYLSTSERDELCASAIRLAKSVNYSNAGTVEFLMDVTTGKFYFIEVNPRIQVEHTFTEQVTGIDIVKSQIRLADGAKIGSKSCSMPKQKNIKLNGHAMQCRITTENPTDNFTPDYGRITAYRGSTGFGIRLDGGTAYSGAIITRYYDSMIEKVTAWAREPDQVISRMNRALREFRIRGVKTNLLFLENLINHPTFKEGSYTTNFIDTTPELFALEPRKDRATKLMNFIAEVIINGNPEVKGRPKPRVIHTPKVPPLTGETLKPGTKDILDIEGPEGLAKWMKDQKQLLITDTSMRDAHQSLLATRMRTHDMNRIAATYADRMPDLFSMECWGGATFDVAMRFLNECPWERLHSLRSKMPNIMTQMLLRSSNAVGYTNYPDNVVQDFILRSKEAGMDVFRVFDSLNWVENMRVAMDAVIEVGGVCEGTICYTGDLNDESRSKYNLSYYVKMAKELEAAGAHILGLKDMAGLLKPLQARKLITALKQEVGLPIHFHTHDTSGISAASVLAAAEAGVDAVDLAMDSLSGLTSQPNMGSVIAALEGTRRDTGLDLKAVQKISDYWDAVRAEYAAFESDIRAGASEVYHHEMPGGQFTNLKEQARAIGLSEQWPDVARAYADTNMLFGDIVKVTPSSKVVGDMALMMVTQGITKEDMVDPNVDVAFPESVVSFFRGDLGQPYGGFPKDLQKKILKGEKPITCRPGKILPAADLEANREEAKEKSKSYVTDEELASYLMYPKVYIDFALHRHQYGPVSRLATDVYFYGMRPGQETLIELEIGKTLVVQCLAVGEPLEDGQVEVFFEINGQPRVISRKTNDAASTIVENRKASADDKSHVGSPLPGVIGDVAIKNGQSVKSGDVLLTIEAMKMETIIYAENDGTIDEVCVSSGQQVDAQDLLVIYK